MNKYFDEKEDTLKYDEDYLFENDNQSLQSFAKVFKIHELTYIPRSRTNSVSSRYLLRKLESSKKLPSSLYEYFENKLRNTRKLNLKFKRYDNELILIKEDNVFLIL